MERDSQRLDRPDVGERNRTRRRGIPGFRGTQATPLEDFRFSLIEGTFRANAPMRHCGFFPRAGRSLSLNCGANVLLSHHGADDADDDAHS